MSISYLYRTDFDGKTFNSYGEAEDHETTHQIAQDLTSKFNLLLSEQETHLIAEYVYQTYIKD